MAVVGEMILMFIAGVFVGATFECVIEGSRKRELIKYKAELDSLRNENMILVNTINRHIKQEVDDGK